MMYMRKSALLWNNKTNQERVVYMPDTPITTLPSAVLPNNGIHACLQVLYEGLHIFNSRNCMCHYKTIYTTILLLKHFFYKMLLG